MVFFMKNTLTKTKNVNTAGVFLQRGTLKKKNTIVRHQGAVRAV